MQFKLVMVRSPSQFRALPSIKDGRPSGLERSPTGGPGQPPESSLLHPLAE